MIEVLERGGVLPKDWRVLSTTQLTDGAKGSIKIGPFGSSLKKSYLTSNGYKVYGQENVFDNDFGIGNRYINEERFRLLQSCELQPGDFIISMMGTIGQCSIVPDGIEPGIMDSHLIRIRLEPTIVMDRFLLHALRSDLLVEQLKRMSVGGIMSGLSSKIIHALSFPIPPLAEQKKIVKVLDALENSIRINEKTVQECENLKKALTNEVFSKGLPGKNSIAEWNQVTFKDIAHLRKEKFNPVGSSPRNYIGLEHIVPDSGQLSGTGSSDSTTSIKSVFMDGDILFNKLRPYLKKYWLASFDGVCTTELLVIKNNEGVDRDFLYQISSSDNFISYINQKTFGTKMPRADWSIIKDYALKLPDLSEQRGIARLLSAVDQKIRINKQVGARQRELRKGLLNDLLTGKVRA